MRDGKTVHRARDRAADVHKTEPYLRHEGTTPFGKDARPNKAARHGKTPSITSRRTQPRRDKPATDEHTERGNDMDRSGTRCQGDSGGSVRDGRRGVRAR